MYAKFRVAGQEFRSLDEVQTQRKWLRVYEDAKDRLEAGWSC